MEYRLGTLTVDDPEFGRIPIEGDGFSSAGELASLVAVPDVQRQLGLPAEQIASLAPAVRDYRNAMSALFAGGPPSDVDREQQVERLHAGLARRVEEIVGPAAMKRLRTLSWRIRNADALFDAELAAALGLTAAQREQLDRARQDNRKAAAAAMRAVSGARFTTAETFAQHATAAQASGDERLLALLTPEQRASFDRLKREPA